MRTVVMAAALTMAVDGLSLPNAWADDLSGPYLITWSDGTPQTTWTFGPCGEDCLTIAGNKGWKTKAHLVKGQWVIDPVHNTVKCSNGTSESATARGTFDPNTLAGTSVITYPVGCPGHAKDGVTLQFTMKPGPPANGQPS